MLLKSRKIPSVKEPYFNAIAKALCGLFAEIRISDSLATSSKLSKTVKSSDFTNSFVFFDLPSVEVKTSNP